MAYNHLVFWLPCLLLIRASGSQEAFPPDFNFGVSTSAYQIEGGWNADGKGLSSWDYLTHSNPAFIADGSNGDIACDSYHRIDDDIQILKDLKVTQYRFSLAWTRILPQGHITKLNQPGVDYYNELINKLLANNIEPVVTLYHWDLPRPFSILGGLHNEVFIDLFAEYARTAYRLFGDRVKLWITFNEPNIICNYFNAVLGAVTPNYPNGVIEYLCTANLLKAHAEAYSIYKNEFKLQQKGKVGITLNFEWAEPVSNSTADQEAAERRRQFDFGIYANPILNYDYPDVVVRRVAERSRWEGFPETRLQTFTLLEKLKIKGTYDFLGLNHYTTWLVGDAPEPPLDQSSFYLDTKVARYQDPSWEETAGPDNRVVPWGLRKALKWIKQTYNSPEILITECGYSDKTGVMEDDRRVNFYKTYLQAVLEAIHLDKVKVTSFLAWSLMDNFEWNQGYLVKFGLHNVDFNDPNRTRTPRASAAYYRKVIETRLLD